MRVAVIGVGLMGGSAARRLSSLGFEVALWSRSFERASRMASEIGGYAGRDVNEVLGRSEAAIAFLPDDDALLGVVARLRRSDGLIFINSSTVTPRASAAAAAHVGGVGGCFVEAPVIGGPGVLEEGRALFLVSGPKHCVEPAMRVVEALGEAVFISEDYGKASALKLAFNNMLLASLTSMAESLLLAEAYGVDRETFREVLSKTFLEPIASRYYERLTSEEWKTTFRAALAAKDARYCSKALEAKGIPPLVSRCVALVYEYMSYSGMSDEDYGRVYMFYSKLREALKAGKTS